MAHYYFDVKNGSTTRDHAGLRLDSDRDAVARGRSIADQVALQHGPRDHACHVSVIREDGHEVMRLQVGNG